MGRDEKKYKERKGEGMDGDGKGSEGMGMQRIGWVNIERNGKGWKILEETAMNEKGGKLEGWEGKG